jgi:hypothetical protein
MSKRTIVLAIALAALSACGSGKSSSASSSAPNAASAEATPNCNGESPVWALPGPKIFLTSDDRMYGKTRHGEYLCLSDAQAQGYRHGRRPFRHHHHSGDQPF